MNPIVPIMPVAGAPDELIRVLNDRFRFLTDEQPPSAPETSGLFAPTCFLLRKPAAGEVLYDFIPDVPCSFPPRLVGSTVLVEANPTATAVYAFRKGVLVAGVRHYTTFGTLSISTSGIGTWTSLSGASFNGTTDSIQKVAPASQDASLAGVGTCLAGVQGVGPATISVPVSGGSGGSGGGGGDSFTVNGA